MIKFEALIAVFRKRDFLAVVVAVSVYLRHVALRAYLQSYRFETIGSSITKSLKENHL